MNLFLTLSRALANRGHRLTFFNLTDNEKTVRDAGFGFEVMEPDSHPIGTLGRMMHQMSALGNWASMKLQGKFDQLRYDAILSKGPALIRRTGLEAMVIDQAEACTGSVADSAGLPWVSVCNGLSLNTEPRVPPFLTDWCYSESPLAITRNRLAYGCLKVATLNTQNQINRYRSEWRLPPLRRFDQTFSRYAQISQQIPEFDFPRQELPPWFHYVGPIRLLSMPEVAFPWERLGNQPLIYASLGTVLNRNRRIFQSIAEACTGLDAQLVLSLGGAQNAAEYSNLPGSPIVVGFAPQRALLAKAALTITHAGLNTTLESLSNGVPLVAIPISFEQPAIAARIRWTGTGEFIPSYRLTPERLRTIIARVMSEPSYRRSAERTRNALAKTDGCQRAVDIIEQVTQTRAPVLATSVKRVAGASSSGR